MLQVRKNSIAVFIVTCVLVFASQLSFAQVLPKGIKRIIAVEGITEYHLDNGLKVLLLPDASKPTVTVNVTYLVGSRHENYGETGMAHLLEHLMFKGSKKYPNITQDFNSRGMRINGTTWLDRTNYFELFQASDDNLKWALEMEADRMVNSFIAKKDLDSEMTVVRNEFEMGENSPFRVMLKRMQSIAYDWHSYGKATIGNRSDIENVKISNLQAFYRAYYQPDNAVLLVAGKFEPEKTLEWIAKTFGAIPKPKRTLPEFWTVEPTQDGERSFTVRRKGDVQMIVVAYKVPSILQADSDALSFAAQIMGDTPNGRLHKQLVQTGKAAQVFEFGLKGYAPGLQMIGAIVKNGDPIEPVRDALAAAMEDFYKTPPSKEELERVRRNYANQIEKTLSDHEKIGVAMSESIALGDWRLLFNSRDRAKNVTPEQVTAAAKQYFRRDNRTVGVYLPEDQLQRADIPAAPSVAEVLKDFKASEQVATSEAFDPSQANIDARTQHLEIGGLKVSLLPKKNRGETVSVAMTLRWGDEKTLFNKQTVSNVTAAMLMRGNSKFSREQLEDEFSKLKISGNINRFDTTRANLADALRLVSQVLKEPTFPATEFEQLRKELQVNLEATRSEPNTLARQAIAQHFNRYPKGDWRTPLTIDETLASFKQISLEEVKAFHKEFYGASKGELSIVGDFDSVEVKKIIEEIYGNWKSTKPYTRIAEDFFDVEPMRKVIDTPDKENGFFTARINLNLRDDDPDYPALMVADYIFGGAGLNSRLMQRIRQKDGLSYGGNSSLNVGSLDRAANFTISAIAAPQNLVRLDSAIKEELMRVLKDGFTAEELARAKSGLIQQRLQTRAQDGALAQGWNNYAFLGRTFAWSKELEDKVVALTVDKINAAFSKAIDPAKMSIVVAGDETRKDAK